MSSSAQINKDGMMYSVPDVVAPGHDVWSCIPGGSYQKLSGTSMAAPVVSGLACIIRSRHPGIGVHEVIDRILATCYPLTSPRERQGNGLVNSRAAF
jgi:subtilisin family serine protease